MQGDLPKLHLIQRKPSLSNTHSIQGKHTNASRNKFEQVYPSLDRKTIIPPPDNTNLFTHHPVSLNKQQLHAPTNADDLFRGVVPRIVIVVRVFVCVSLPFACLVHLQPSVLVDDDDTRPRPNNDAKRPGCTVVEREWTSSGYGLGTGSSERAAAELLPRPGGERKGTSGQQLESPRGRPEISSNR